MPPMWSKMVDDLSLLLGIASRKLARPSGQCIEFMSRERVVSESFDYDLLIIGAGVGGHGAALHAVKSGLKTAIVEADVMGGTCVNRGCIPSKALLAASGRVRELRNEHHLKALGIQIGQVSYDRGGHCRPCQKPGQQNSGRYDQQPQPFGSRHY